LRSIRRHAVTALVTGLAVVAPSLLAPLPARAATGSAALADCNAHDSLTHVYSVAALQNALATMPATMKEYTDCPDVIGRALTDALGARSGTGGGGGGGGGGSFLPAPVIVVLVLLALAAATFGAIAVRRRRGD
jgi:hypothetical protein